MANRNNRNKQKKFKTGVSKQEKNERHFPENIYRSWMFHSGDKGQDTKFGWDKILEDGSEEDLKDVMNKIAHFETMSDQEIHKSNKSHPIPIRELPSKAQNRIKNIKTEEWFQEAVSNNTKIFSYRITKTKRLWCFQNINFGQNQVIYEILWWDPTHEVYPSDK